MSDMSFSLTLFSALINVMLVASLFEPEAIILGLNMLSAMCGFVSCVCYYKYAPNPHSFNNTPGFVWTSTPKAIVAKDFVTAGGCGNINV